MEALDFGGRTDLTDLPFAALYSVRIQQFALAYPVPTSTHAPRHLGASECQHRLRSTEYSADL